MKSIGDLVENREVYSVPLGATVAEAVHYMTERHIGAVCVTVGDLLVGIFSERDLLKRVIAPDRQPAATPLAEVISRDPITADAGESPAACLERMRKARIRHLPVFRSGRLLGLVTMRDLMLADLEEKGHEVRMMRAYIAAPAE